MATIVLVHGTTAGGWVWQDVAPQLEAAGHIVHTPTLTGLGERSHLLTPEVGLDTHIEDIVNVLIYRDLTDVVLAGHSYGGMVIAGVADRVPERIKHLVYLDAVVPQDGDSVISRVGSAMRGDRLTTILQQGDGWLVPVSHGPNDVPSHNKPHPLKTWTDPISLTNPAREEIPATYVGFFPAEMEGAQRQSKEAMMEALRAKGCGVRVIHSVHQIMADPQPKADILLELLAEI